MKITQGTSCLLKDPNFAAKFISVNFFFLSLYTKECCLAGEKGDLISREQCLFFLNFNLSVIVEVAFFAIVHCFRIK